MSTAVATSALHLECIDGKDDHFVIQLEAGEKKVLGGFDDDAVIKLKELEHQGGAIVINNENGQLVIDATDCTIPVKINGAITSKCTVKTTDILRIGNSIWKTVRIAEPEIVINTDGATKTSFTKGFGTMIGLDELKDFKISNIFSGVFKKHTLADTEEQLFTGTSKNIPALTDIEISWARPWLFSRLITICIALTLLLILGFNRYQNTNLLPGLIFIGTFMMPLATLIFYLEVNAPRNVSIFLVLLMLFIGGVTSLLVTLILSQPLEFLYKTFGDAAAAIIEEPAKILIVVLVLGKYVRFKWILNGLLLGGAVGAGFGAFESAGYAFNAYDQWGFQPMVDSIVLRGLLAPFMHVVWTANAAAALWMVKGDKPFSWDMLGSGKFLRILALSIITHFIWNSDFTLIPLPLVKDVKFLLLGVLSWTVCFMLIQAGLKQLNEARHAEIERLRAE
jgi:protease PrsW